MSTGLLPTLLCLLLLCLCGTLAAAAPAAAAEAAADAVRVRRDAGGVEVETTRLRVRFDLKTGLWEAHWPQPVGESATVRGASCAARLTDGTELRAADYPRHESGAGDVRPIRDSLGAGSEIVVRHTSVGASGDRPTLLQRFRFYADLPYVLVRLEVIGGGAKSVATSDLSPLVVDAAATPGAGLRLPGATSRPRTLFVPYDNDEWVRFNSDYASDSYEVTAVYDNASRRGFVVGAVTHDLWKTGLAMGGHAPGRLGSLRAYGGATGRWTHDSRPHGAVSGARVASEEILVGWFADWRDGLEAYGAANGRLRPPLAWSEPGGVPFGWNSWAAHKEKVSFDHYVAASAFLKQTLSPQGFGDAGGNVYVNFDSYWDNLSDEKIAEAVRRVRAAGQKPGIYWTPFVCWGGDLDRPVEGTDGRWRYRDILLRDSAGEPLPKLDGGMPIDPTHPGSLARIDAILGRFVAQGFDFVKLDFLTHGSLEGAHFDPTVPTGTAAYHVGMKRVVAALSPEKAGRPVFISLSIAPLFPAGYGHARRISCDAAGGVGATEYLLNSLTYGWWAQGGLYHFNDPDHTVLYQEGGQPHPVTEVEGRSRLNASVISGTMLLVSDDLTDAAERSRAADTFVRRDGDPGARVFYVALFNHDREKPRTAALNLARLGLDPAADYEVRDLWSGRVTRASGTLPVDLPPTASTILRLTPR